MSEGMSDDYPKIMTRRGAEVSATCASDEADKRAEGWVSPLDATYLAQLPAGPLELISEVPPFGSQAPASEELDDEPTFGPPGDQTHAKRPAKGKKR